MRFKDAGTIPTGGSPNQYISIASASTGLACTGYTGAAADTLTDNFTLNSINLTRFMPLPDLMA